MTKRRTTMLTRSLLALALLPSIAAAAIVEVEWTWPTQWADDGSPLALSELREIVLEHGACNSTNTGLLTIDGVVRVAPPAVRTQFNRDTPGPACLRASVTTLDGINSDSLYLPFTVGVPPEPNARPEPPTVVRISLIWPQLGPVVVGRPASGGGLTTSNYVYRRANTVQGNVTLGRVAVGTSCDCTAAFQAAWSAGTGQYCDVAGAINLGNTSIVPTGAPFPAGSFTRCD